jgi:hypothetical protein
MMRDPLEIPDPFENGIWPSCKSFDVLFRLDPTVVIPRRSRHCMDDVGNQALRCRPVPLVSEVGHGRAIPDQFRAGFCPTCGTFDPVFGVYRIAGDQCSDPHHEPTEVSE